MHRLDSKDLIELARNLIAMEVELPLKLEQVLVKDKHLQLVVEYYLNKKSFNFEKAFEIVWRHLPESVENIAETNLNTLALLLQILEEALDANRDNLRDLNNDLQHLQPLAR